MSDLKHVSGLLEQISEAARMRYLTQCAREAELREKIAMLGQAHDAPVDFQTTGFEGKYRQWAALKRQELLRALALCLAEKEATQQAYQQDFGRHHAVQNVIKVGEDARREKDVRRTALTLEALNILSGNF